MKISMSSIYLLLTPLNLSLVDTPCTTDKGSEFHMRTLAKTHIDCTCHRINTSTDVAWKQVKKK